MPSRYMRRVHYSEFEKRVRRHRSRELLEAIAQMTVFQAERGSRPPRERLLLPWALACAAKEALRFQTTHRPSGVILRDLQEICGAFNALYTPFGDHPTISDAALLMVRTSYEQFPYQVSEFEEVSRPHCMFSITAKGSETEILSDDLWQRALGCSIPQAAGLAILLSTSAEKNRGHFHTDWLTQPNFKEVVAELPATVIEEGLTSWLAADPEWFRQEVERFRSDDERVRRYDYNPLFGRPVISLGEGDFLAPIHPLVLRRVSPSALYFTALQILDPDDQRAFTRDVGTVFEAYVGAQLAQIPDVEIIPEIRYGADQLSIDWFVVWRDLVVLVEAKSTPHASWKGWVTST